MISDLIYDVGMNNGDDTAYYLHRGFRVVAIEADPVLVAQAEQRFGRTIADGRLTILNLGIAEEPGRRTFWICESHSPWNSFDRRVASRNDSRHHGIEVPCRRFLSILEEFGVPFYLKVDIEGNDPLCLQDLSPHDLPKYVSVEADGLAMLTRLRDLGYLLFKCISQYHFMALESPPSQEQQRYEKSFRLLHNDGRLIRVMRPLTERLIKRGMNRARRLNGWVFRGGSSGPFGEDTRGRWLSFAEMRETYLRFERDAREHGLSPFWRKAEYSFWADFHASRDG